MEQICLPSGCKNLESGRRTDKEHTMLLLRSHYTTCLNAWLQWPAVGRTVQHHALASWWYAWLTCVVTAEVRIPHRRHSTCRPLRIALPLRLVGSGLGCAGCGLRARAEYLTSHAAHCTVIRMGHQIGCHFSVVLSLKSSRHLLIGSQPCSQAQRQVRVKCGFELVCTDGLCRSVVLGCD